MDDTGQESQSTHEALRDEVLAAALARVHEWPGAGRFVVARENTFAAHCALVRNMRTGGLGFSAALYPYFDKLIPEAGYFSAPAHDNLACLRNFIFSLYYRDAVIHGDGGAYGLSDMADIAVELNQGLRNATNPLPEFIAPRLSKAVLNVEGSGAAHAYAYLLRRQRREGLLGDIIAAIRGWLGLSTRDWGLLPMTESPFAHLRESPPQDVLTMPDEELDRYVREIIPPAAQEVAKYEQSRQNIPPVESNLESKVKREVIDHGIVILRWFKNLEFTDKSAMELLEAGTPEEKAEMVGAVGQFVQYYQQITARALQTNPSLAQREKVREANTVAKVMQHTIKLLAALEKPVSIAQTQQISTDVTRQPERWNEMANRTVNRLMDTLKGGLESVVSAFEQQQEDAQQQQEQSVEQALDHGAGGDQSRRKRRRKQRSAGVTSGKRQQRLDQAVHADDYALGQGLHAHTGGARANYVQGQVAFKQSLQVREVALKDMEIVKALGKTIAQSTGSPKETKPASGGGGAGSLPKLSSGLQVSEASLNDKLAPDQQENIAQRIIEQRKRDQQNPGGGKKL